MKRGAIIVGVLVFAFFIISGCSSKQNPSLIISSLKEAALSANDIGGLNLISERNLTEKLENGQKYYAYLKTFNNAAIAGSKDAAGFKEITNRLYVFSSSEEAKKFVVTSYQGFNEFNIEKIGDESFAFSGTVSGKNLIIIWFRKNNVVSALTLQGGDSKEAFRYAKIAESKI